jgi:hypothetical protein
VVVCGTGVSRSGHRVRVGSRCRLRNLASSPGGLLVDESEGATPNNVIGHASDLEVLPDGDLMGRVLVLTAIHLGNVAFGTWNHVVLRYNGTTLDGFLNGVVSSATTTGTRTTPWSTSHSL